MNQKPFRTLLLWIIWGATAVITYFSLYRGGEVWEFVRSDQSRITWLIIGLFVFGLIGSFILTIMVTLEALVANRVDESVAGQGLKVIDRLPRQRAVGRFFIELKTTTETGNGSIDTEALLTSELSIYQRISHSIDVIGNLLITLGLIGTVVGLTLVLTGLTGSLEALGHDSEMMLSGLRKAMAGMGTAFYTTLLGAVLGGVLLRVFAQITEHGINSVYDAVMRTCLVHCAADLQPSMQRDLRQLDTQIEALGLRIKVLQHAFNESRETMSRFREEAVLLRDLSQDENKILLEHIRLHKHSIEMMRGEVNAMRRINKSWWERLRDVIMGPKS
ncbi:MAG: MotA/TolQ/ExbB proton channel family protein [Gammaproteobacteria bacterium]|nr:MotA/TolQ/ExbB proton channel family protein [Gammaproteobacteria bacterium]